MRIIKPNKIETVNVLSMTAPSSTVLGDVMGGYDDGIVYALGDKVEVGSPYHRLYESLIDGNVGLTPPADHPAAWLDIGPQNEYALFDSEFGSETRVEVGTTTLQYVVRPAYPDDGNVHYIDAMAFLSSSADSVRVRAVSDTLGSIFDTTYDLT